MISVQGYSSIVREVVHKQLEQNKKYNGQKHWTGITIIFFHWMKE
jgi:hypothetical protein